MALAERVPLVRIGAVNSFPPGEMRQWEHEEEIYVVCNVAGAFHLMDGICPHSAGPLAHGALHGHMVVCPFHAWEFDCRTGEYDRNPCVRLKTFEVSVRGTDLYVELP
jgi:nitrite reductase (NADH) small subunit